MSRRAIGVFCLLLAGIPPPLIARGPGAAGEPRFAGQSLAEALSDLQKRGLTIVFTSELVRSHMKVIAEPSSDEPRRILDEILVPHGLAVREALKGVLVVVAVDVAEPAHASIEGRVLQRRGRGGVAGARVRILENEIEAAVARDGTFGFDGIAPGRYTLEATAPGYAPKTADVSVDAGVREQVVFRLQPVLEIRDEIVVQPSRLSLLLDSPDSFFSLDREAIESLPHLGGDVFRAMSLLPGVAAGDVTAQFSVHGGRRDEVRVLLDGQEIFGTYHLKDYDNALSIIHSQALAAASLTTGAFPASQGDRMSGVLDLRTIEPSERRFVLGLSVVDLLAAASDRFAAGRGAWFVAARRGSIDYARDALGDEDPSFWDVFAKAELATAAGLFRAHALVAHDQLRVDTIDEDGFEDLRNDYDNAYGWLTHQMPVASRFLVETIGSYSRIDGQRGGAGEDEQIVYDLRDHRDLDVASLSQSWTMEPGSRHALRWGWEVRRYDASFDYSKAVEPQFTVIFPFSGGTSSVHEFKGDIAGNHVGVWASDRVTLGNRLTAEFGLRYDHHSVTSETLVSPRINLGFRLDDRSIARLAWGRFFQSQRPYELQVEDGETALHEAELSEHWVAGWERFFGTNRSGIEAVRVEAFRRRIDEPRTRYENLLEPLNFFPETEPDRVRIAPEESTARGIEFLVRGSRGTFLDWWVAYSYATARDRIDGRNVPRALDQPHSAVVNLDFRLPREWRLDFAWRYHSGWPTTDIFAAEIDDPEAPGETIVAAVFGPLNGERFPSYHRLDMRASRGWDLRSGRVTFFVDVQNAYDHENVAGYDVVVDEEAGTLEKTPETWPGIVPSLGVVWEF
ncbi:MAG: TonB-dependent receptor [Thermoanaerobaculia bacterium]